ncbi:MAG: hypothetical protein AAF589_04070 [Planctomycetota bacterium]
MADKVGCLKELPSELAYLAEPAMRYGVHQFDNDIDRFLSNASNEQLDELAALADRVKINDHYPEVNEWLDDHGIDKYKEAANLYFLFGIMDAADLDFESA